MAVLYCRPETGLPLGVEPELASWDKAGSPSQRRLAAFLAEVEDLARPVIAAIDGPLAIELVVGLPDHVPLASGGGDLDIYLYLLAQRLGASQIAAMFARKVHGRGSVLAIGPAQPDPRRMNPGFTAQVSGSYARTQWKADLRDALRADTSEVPAGAGRAQRRHHDRSGPELGEHLEAPPGLLRARPGRGPGPAVPPLRRPCHQLGPASPDGRRARP